MTWELQMKPNYVKINQNSCFEHLKGGMRLLYDGTRPQALEEFAVSGAMLPTSALTAVAFGKSAHSSVPQSQCKIHLKHRSPCRATPFQVACCPQCTVLATGLCGAKAAVCFTPSVLCFVVVGPLKQARGSTDLANAGGTQLSQLTSRSHTTHADFVSKFHPSPHADLSCTGQNPSYHAAGCGYPHACPWAATQADAHDALS